MKIVPFEHIGDFEHEVSRYFQPSDPIGESKRRAMGDSELSARSLAEHDFEVHMERFEAMVKYEMHAEIAITAALLHCAEHKMPPPQWLTVKATKLLCELLQKKRKKKSGRSTSPCDRYVQDRIMYERWDMVRDTRERQISERHHVEDLKKIPRVPRALLEEREGMLKWAGSDLLKAVVCASERLQGTKAYAGPDAIKKSYLQCQHHLRGRISSLRFWPFDRRLLNSLGIDIDFEKREKGTRPPETG